MKKILEHSIVLNLHTKLNFSCNNPYFNSIPPKKYYIKSTIIRDLFLNRKFFQPQSFS